MDLGELAVFAAVAEEASFSGAARRLHRTQPAVSQALKRLEDELGQRLFDRSSRRVRLTEAGRILLDYAQRLMRLSEEAAVAVAEVRDLKHGRILVGANEAAVHLLLPLIARFRDRNPEIQVDVRRVASRQVGLEVLEGSLDFGALSFRPGETGLASLRIGEDELVMLTHPSHPLAGRKSVTMAEMGSQVVIAHNEPSPARERVIRLFEHRHTPLRILILDAIKRAVEMKLGIALLPRRCAIAEITLGQLAAVPVTGIRMPRQVRLVYRREGPRSHAAEAFLAEARQGA
jgi:DNA-binding transcriptional LysR family regulator